MFLHKYIKVFTVKRLFFITTTGIMQREQPCNDQVLVDRVASELESIRYFDSNSNTCCSSSTSSCSSRSSHGSSNSGSSSSLGRSVKSGGHHNDIGVKFPNACLQLLQSIPGNQNCVDCGKCNPDWASITYGVLMCLQCSGIHRSYGVQISYVRSIQYDTWNHQQIVSLLEGGNTQLRTFFHRHQLLNNSSTETTSCRNQQQQYLYNQRYQTKAALFYKVNLKQHVSNVIQNGAYRGRDYNRKQASSRISRSSSSTHIHNHKDVAYRSKSPTTVLVVAHGIKTSATVHS